MNSEELFSQITNEIPDAKAGKMFGCSCIKMTNGKAGAMLKDDKLIVKISGETLEEAQKLSGVGVFTPMENRPMNGWYEIPLKHQSDWKKFAQASCSEVAKLEKKPSKKKSG